MIDGDRLCRVETLCETGQLAAYTMFNMPRDSNQRGYVLVIVLGLLLALFIMALSLSTAVRSDLARSRRFQDKMAAAFLAKGGVEWAMHTLNELARQDGLWRASWQDQPAWFQDRRLGAGVFSITYVDSTGRRRYGIQDEEARINLNTASSVLLAALPGLPAAAVRAIVVQRQQRPFATPEELLGRGIVSPSVFYGTAERAGVGSYLTVWGSGKINVNTAPRPVLAALPGMTSAMADAIVRYRQGNDQRPGTADDRYFRTVDDLSGVAEIDHTDLVRFKDFLTVTPTAFRVVVVGRIPNRQGKNRTHRRLVIIDRTGRPMQIRYWRRLE
jgi:general secretion pathway protein K